MSEQNKKWLPFSLNDYVKVQLNEKGYQLLVNQHNQYCGKIKNWEMRDVEYYKNTGTLEKPFFIPENMSYDKYSSALPFEIDLPYPVFFADRNGDSSPDMFVIKDKVYNSQQQKSEYKVLYAENALGLDTGVLITIVLVLLIIVLLIAVIR